MAKFLTATILKVPKELLAASIVILCFTGAFAFKNSLFDLWVIIAFGIVGYLFNKFNIPFSALILSVVLGALLESSYQQSMVLSNDSFTIFFTQPISLGLLIAAALFVFYPAFSAMFRRIKDVE